MAIQQITEKEQKINMNKEKALTLLRKSMGREPKENEVINSLKNPSFLIQNLSEQVEELEERINKLEGKIDKT